MKFCVMCRMQYTWTELLLFQPLPYLEYALRMDSWRSEMRQKSYCGVTYLRKFHNKKNQASSILPFTMMKAIGNMFLWPYCATVTNNVRLYFPYKKVSSTLTTGLQNLKPSMYGLNVQNTLLKMMWSASNWLPSYAGW